MPTLRPFRAEDLLAFPNRDGQGATAWRLAFEKERGLAAFTGLDGDTVLGCSGIVSPWEGVGIAWMELAEEVGRHPLWMTKMVRRVMEDTMRAHGLHRVEAVVRADNERNQRWIEMLGFTPEQGKARAYTSEREDCIRYERV